MGVPRAHGVDRIYLTVRLYIIEDSSKMGWPAWYFSGHESNLVGWVPRAAVRSLDVGQIVVVFGFPWW